MFHKKNKRNQGFSRTKTRTRTDSKFKEATYHNAWSLFTSPNLSFCFSSVSNFSGMFSYCHIEVSSWIISSKIPCFKQLNIGTHLTLLNFALGTVSRKSSFLEKIYQSTFFMKRDLYERLDAKREINPILALSNTVNFEF